jgi:hypothetical protein
MIRTLHYGDIARAHALTDEEREALAAPLLARLRALSCHSERDPCGIPYRGEWVYSEQIEGADPLAVAALRNVLMYQHGNRLAIDACEFATLAPDTPASPCAVALAVYSPNTPASTPAAAPADPWGRTGYPKVLWPRAGVVSDRQ